MSELVKAAQRVVDAILGPWSPGDSDTLTSAISEIREAAQELKAALREADSSRAERDALQEAHDRLCAELAEAKAQIAKLHHQHTQALALLTEHHADRIRDLGLADAVTRKEFDECHAALRDTERARDEARARLDRIRDLCAVMAKLDTIEPHLRQKLLEIGNGSPAQKWPLPLNTPLLVRTADGSVHVAELRVHHQHASGVAWFADCNGHKRVFFCERDGVIEWHHIPVGGWQEVEWLS